MVLKRITKLGKGNVFFVIGADVEEEAPIAFLRIKGAVNGGATLVVANGRKTKLDRYGTVLPYRYGDEGRLLASLLNVVVNENLHDADASHRRPQNFSGWNMAHPRYTSRNTATTPEMR